jgi:hypothetical protein
VSLYLLAAAYVCAFSELPTHHKAAAVVRDITVLCFYLLTRICRGSKTRQKPHLLMHALRPGNGVHWRYTRLRHVGVKKLRMGKVA